MINNIFNFESLVDKYSSIYDYKNTISIHFRIGDFKSVAHVPILNIEYYINSLNKVILDTGKNNWNILYFYEKVDQLLIEKNITILNKEFENLNFIGINNELQDWEQMIVMSLCRHNIIANSTFSWWGAYLNKNDNFVYYPDTWFHKNVDYKTDDLIPENWMKITNNKIKKKIKFFCNWDNDSNLLKRIINTYDWDSDKYYNNLYRFTLKNDYTHAVLYNNVKPKLTIPKNNVIGLAQEPIMFLRFDNDYRKFCNKHIKKYYIGKKSKSDSSEEIIEYSNVFPMVLTKNINYKLNKCKLMNYVYSDKKYNYPDSYYNYRHELGEKIIEDNLEIEIYGRSTELLKKKYPNNPHIKYKFEHSDIHKIYQDYKFTIVIENCSEPEYFSEKITDVLLCGGIPIYLGCLNIDKYFKDYVVHLTGNLYQDMEIINEILINPDKYYKKVDIKKIQEIIHLKHKLKNFI